MKTFFKGLLGFLLVVVVAVGIWAGMNWFHVKHFPSIISSFSSKTMCSCLFVAGRDEAFCKAYAKQWVPIQSVEIDAQNKSVKVKGLWRTNEAKYLNERHGCELQKLQ